MNQLTGTSGILLHSGFFVFARYSRKYLMQTRANRLRSFGCQLGSRFLSLTKTIPSRSDALELGLAVLDTHFHISQNNNHKLYPSLWMIVLIIYFGKSTEHANRGFICLFVVTFNANGHHPQGFPAPATARGGGCRRFQALVAIIRGRLQWGKKDFQAK